MRRTGSVLVWLARWSPLGRRWEDTPQLHRAKQRIYRVCLLMSLLMLVITALLPQADPRIFQIQLFINAFGFLVALIALICLRWTRWLRLIELLMATGIFAYTILWDSLFLILDVLPSREFVITYGPVFLLGAVILSLMVPQRALLPLLALPFSIHALLTGLLLSRSAWSDLHSARLVTNLATLITLVPLMLLGEYQQAVVLAEQATQSIHKLAETDPLTGILNRRGLMSQLNREITVMALLDIDHFKSINDTFGHEQGDAVLQGVGECLASLTSADPSGLQNLQVGRWGGEEFLVLLRQPPAEGVAVWAEHLRAGLQRLCPNGLPITVSIGAAVQWPEEPVEQTLKRVDQLVYQAKFGGRNRVAVAAEEAKVNGLI
ncbi:MAG: hypothetical protein JWQ08_1954 [Deinococcus sp.]|nr:hypothetical protein [Deinococcus sp.]